MQSENSGKSSAWEMFELVCSSSGYKWCGSEVRVGAKMDDFFGGKTPNDLC